MFDHIIKHPEVRQKCSAVRRFFNSLLGVWKCGQTRSFVFDILLIKVLPSCSAAEKFRSEKNKLTPQLDARQWPWVVPHPYQIKPS